MTPTTTHRGKMPRQPKETNMTKAQINQLHTILGKTEALQLRVENVRVRDQLGAAKTELLRALAMAEA